MTELQQQLQDSIRELEQIRKMHQLEAEKGNVKSKFDQLEQQRKEIIVKASAS